MDQIAGPLREPNRFQLNGLFQAFGQYFLEFGLEIGSFIVWVLKRIRRSVAFFIAIVLVISIIFHFLRIAIISVATIIPDDVQTQITYWIFGRNGVSSSSNTSFSNSPLLTSILLCHVPFVSTLIGCPNPTSNHSFHDIIQQQTTSLSPLRDEVAVGTGLVINARSLGSIALPTVIQVVNVSEIAGKEALLGALLDTQEQSSTVVDQLQNFTWSIQDGLATITAINMVVLRPFSSSRSNSNNFDATFSVYQSIIKRVQDTTSIANEGLIRLDFLLDNLNDVAITHYQMEITDRDRVLTEIWTRFGGNKLKLSKSSQDLDILQTAMTFRKNAKMHVILAGVVLDTMIKGLTELQRRTEFSWQSDGNSDFVLELQFEIVRQGLESLLRIDYASGNSDYRRIDVEHHEL